MLEACLRSGIAAVYGCSNGNCGSCKATLKSGEIDQVRYHDFTLTVSDKMAGCFLMCASRALTNIEVEADVTQSPDDIPVQNIETKVKAVEYLDPQVVRLHLQTPRSRRLRFIAGQSVMLETGDELQSIYALASCPCDDRNLHFHIPDIPGDKLSESVFAGKLSPRDTVQLRGPQRGTFYLDDKDDRHSLILCWHTGFAPIISLIEHAMSLENEKEIHLFRFSPTPERQYLSNLCRSWSDAYDNITSVLMPNRVTLLSTTRECEEILASVAARFPDLSDLNIYVVGPSNFVEAAENVVSGFGVSAGQVKTRTDWLGVID